VSRKGIACWRRLRWRPKGEVWASVAPVPIVPSTFLFKLCSSSQTTTVDIRESRAFFCCQRCPPRMLSDALSRISISRQPVNCQRNERAVGAWLMSCYHTDTARTSVPLLLVVVSPFEVDTTRIQIAFFLCLHRFWILRGIFFISS
jgi:hypothetical protein